MHSNVVSHQAENYQVVTSVYEGPLDLLLQLIEHAELDITTLALAQVTDQYLAYLRHLQIQDPGEVSAFLVIAARLLQIKSAALLPRPPQIDVQAVDPDSAEELARQLILYRRFKQLSAILTHREEAGMKTFLRIAPLDVKIEPRLDLSNITLSDLVSTARQVFSIINNQNDMNLAVKLPRITIRDKISTIISALKNQGKVTFRAMLKTRERSDVVITFLAMLELIKRHIIHAEQTSIFSDIELVASSDLNTNLEGDSEFGD